MQYSQAADFNSHSSSWGSYKHQAVSLSGCIWVPIQVAGDRGLQLFSALGSGTFHSTSGLQDWTFIHTILSSRGMMMCDFLTVFMN